jgi:hypothetical protein
MNQNSHYRIAKRDEISKVGLGILIGMCGYHTLLDAKTSYEKIRREERAVAPIITTADNLLTIRAAMADARYITQQRREGAETWAGLLRMDIKCIADGRIERRIAEDTQIIATLDLALTDLREIEYGLRLAVRSHRARIIEPLENNLQTDAILGALLSLGVMGMLIQRRED